MDLEALRSKVVKRVFRAWVEDWEKECIKDKDAVSEVRLLRAAAPSSESVGGYV